VKVEYDRSKLLDVVEVDDYDDLHPHPFSLLYFDLHTYSGILASDDAIRVIKVRYEQNYVVFDNSEEKVILQQFSDYVHEKNPDIIICMGDYDNGKMLQYLFARAKKIGFDLQLGRDAEFKGRICISSSYRKTTYFDEFGFAGLIERARFGFLPLDMAAKYSINRLIDSRNCFELIQRGFVIPSRVRDKGGMIISPQIGLHEDVLALDYEEEEHHGMQMGMEKHEKASSSSSTATNNATQVSIVKGASTLDNKAFSPNHIKIKVGGTVIWTNDDSNIHTVTSGVPNAPNAGQVFDSGLTSLISPSKTYSHKFTYAGEFSYFCRLHPTMVEEIEVTP
jgi:plastocyanin